MENNKILNFSEFGIDDYMIGSNIIGQLYIRIDKDNSYHKFNAKVYGGQCISHNSIPRLLDGYVGSGVNLEKKNVKKRIADRKTKMFEIANFSYICSKKILDKTEGWLITTLHNVFENRCLNKVKIHSESMNITKEIEAEVEKLLRKYLSKKGEIVTDEKIAHIMKNKKQRVYNWAKRHNYIDIRYAINNNMFNKTNWDPLDLLLYQSLLNKKIMDKAINDIEDFLGYNVFENKNVA